jgi:hypothetical protein
MTVPFSIIVPTKDRCEFLERLLESIRRLRGLTRIQPEVIIGDNASRDRTWETLRKVGGCFPTPLHTLRVSRPGKSAVLNDAVRFAKGDVLAFLDDDVVADPGWLEATEAFFLRNGYAAGQGMIRLQPPDSEDPEVLTLLHRYRTIPTFEDPVETPLGSLNGANMAIRKAVIDTVGGFDERLGPGASGTSEDVDLAKRILRAGMKIGYMKESIAFHHVDRFRLTEAYFKSIHRRQGLSRALIKNRYIGRIFFDLAHASLQYALYGLVGNQRKKYRGKGRIFHYLGMLEAKIRR